MAYTFEDVWRKVLLHAPEVPVFLAREFTQAAFAQACDMRPWLHQRVEVFLQTRASRTVTVTFLNGSTALTSAGGFVVATDPGRQIKVDSIPIFTIDAVADVNTATLLDAWTGADGPQTATILDAYLVCPVDFGAFLTIADPSTQRIIPFWFTEEQLNAMDPHRTAAGDPARALFSKGVSAATPTLGRVLYEWWPQPTAARTYPALYRKRPPTLADRTVLPGVLAQRGDVLIQGALAECAQWPGTAQRPNPYFNLSLHQLKKAQFLAELTTLMLRDDDQGPMDLPQIPWHEYQAWQATDPTLLRASDATLDSYY